MIDCNFSSLRMDLATSFYLDLKIIPQFFYIFNHILLISYIKKIQWLNLVGLKLNGLDKIEKNICFF